MRRARAVLLGLLVAGPGSAAWVYAASEARLTRRYACAPAPVAPATDASAVARGRRLATGVALCTFCHGDDLGGRAAVDDRWIGRLYAPNLTRGRGGVAAVYGDADFERAIRHGVGRDGRSLLVMPSEYLNSLEDADLADLIAYLRNAAPVDAITPSREVGALTRLVLVLGLAPELLSAEGVAHGARESDPGRAASADSGRYLVDIGACRVCHGRDLRGGRHPLSLPEEPTPPDLTRGSRLRAWSERDFARALRAGATPDGRRLDPRFMPWPRFAVLDDAQVRAIWIYLRTLAPAA